MDTERIQLGRTHDSPFLDKGNQPLQKTVVLLPSRSPEENGPDLGNNCLRKPHF
jgi:hypothetical protein